MHYESISCFAKHKICHRVYCHFMYQLSKKKAWLQTTLNQTCISMYIITAIFAVWVDFAFVPAFFAFLLKIRNCEFFIMICLLVCKCSTRSRCASFLTSRHYCVRVLFWRKCLHLYNAHKKRSTSQKKEPKNTESSTS